jgi:ribosomal protein S18 acetylase RimI-like enzyme
VVGPATTAIRPATAGEVPRLAESLARAFQDDPGWSHLLRDPADRTERLRLFFETELRNVAMPQGAVWVTDDLDGGAVWAPPGAWRVPVSTTLREVGPMIRVFGRRLPLALRSRLRMEGKHPKDPPHWYLAVLGVEPASQGRGLGSKLMHPVLERLDADGVAAYLEASTPRSRALYERHGFEVTGEMHLPANGPPIWLMWREPATR